MRGGGGLWLAEEPGLVLAESRRRQALDVLGGGGSGVRGRQKAVHVGVLGGRANNKFKENIYFCHKQNQDFSPRSQPRTNKQTNKQTNMQARYTSPKLRHKLNEIKCERVNTSEFFVLELRVV